MNKWDKIKYNLLEHINKNKINNFHNFNQSLKMLSTKDKGDYFEYFCKLYFNLDVYAKNNYKNFYLYTEIPVDLKHKLNLPKIKVLIVWQ